MKKFIAAVCLIIISFMFSAFAQESKNEKKELMDKILASYQKGEFEEAVKLGEKLVKLEKKSNDSVSYVNSLVNLARIKSAYFVSLQNEIANSNPKPLNSKEIWEKANQNANDAEELFREALDRNEAAGNGKTAQTADIKRDLARIISNHSYSGTKTVEKSRSRIDEAEKLILDSISISEQTRGKDADQTLHAVSDAGDFYYKYVNFEKALPFYERFIQAYEQKQKTDHVEFVNALRSYASILFTTFQDQEAAAVIKRIESITKKVEPVSNRELNLHLRSKDSVAYSAPIITDFNEMAESNRRLSTAGVLVGTSNRPRMISVPVGIEVDETGKIVKTAAKTNDAKLKNEAESVVSKWTVRPFSFNGEVTKMRGFLIYRKSQ